MSVVVKQVLGQEMVEYFYSIIMSLLDYYLPFVRRYSFNCDKPWVTSEFRNLTKRRQIAFLSGQFSLYRKLRNQTKSSTTEALFALALFVDFRKAFGIINHNVLFSKLNNFNIPHCLLKWFVSYLSLRWKRVRVGHQVSSWKTDPLWQYASGFTTWSIVFHCYDRRSQSPMWGTQIRRWYHGATGYAGYAEA